MTVKNDVDSLTCCQVVQRGVKGFFGGREWKNALFIEACALLGTALAVAEIVVGILIIMHVMSYPMRYGIGTFLSGALPLPFFVCFDIALLVNAIISAKRAIRGEPGTKFISWIWEKLGSQHAASLHY